MSNPRAVLGWADYESSLRVKLALWKIAAITLGSALVGGLIGMAL